MFRFFSRYPAARLLLLLPALVVAGCGNNTGAVITVPNQVVVGDLQNNGVMDIAVVAAQIDETGLTQKPGLLSIFLNTVATPGTFQTAVNYVSSSAPPSGLAIGDLTGTGSHDLVTANLNRGTLSVFMETSPSSGAYNAAVTITVGGQPNDVQIADINGDGLPDLIVADNLGAIEYVLQNPASPGTFGTPVKLTISNPAIVAEGLATRGVSVAVGDLNGDGLPDLAVTSFDADGDYGMIFVFFQTAPGVYGAAPMTITALGEPSQIRIADLNQDGSNDMVVAMQGLGDLAGSIAAEDTPGALIILQNHDTPGTFATPVLYAATTGVISVAVGDLDGDGLPDLAMSSLYPEGEGYVVTLIQVPGAPGTFGAATLYLGSGQPSSIVIGDMNNDGLLDLVTSDSTTAVWYENISSAPGTFASEGQVL